MGSLRMLALAGATMMTVLPGANAADLAPIPQPQPVPIYEDFASGWYLRGDVGVGQQDFRAFDFVQTNPAFVWPASWNVESHNFGDTTFVGAGIGYQFSSWLRFDATAEYRSTARVKAVGSYTDFCAGGGKCFDVYDGSHQASVFMANAYFDLGTWGRFTPFVGAGVGGAYHRMSNFWDIGLNSDGSTGRGFAEDHSHWNMAWAVHAGLAYDVAPNLKVELAYRYLNMGTINSGIVDCAGCGTFGPLAYYKLRDADSHDIKLGVRWLLDVPPPPPPAYPPLIRKG